MKDLFVLHLEIVSVTYVCIFCFDRKRECLCHSFEHTVTLLLLTSAPSSSPYYVLLNVCVIANGQYFYAIYGD